MRKRDIYIKGAKSLEERAPEISDVRESRISLGLRTRDGVNDSYRFEGNLIAKMEEEGIATLKAACFFQRFDTKHSALCSPCS